VCADVGLVQPVGLSLLARRDRGREAVVPAGAHAAIEEMEEVYRNLSQLTVEVPEPAIDELQRPLQRFGVGASVCFNALLRKVARTVDYFLTQRQRAVQARGGVRIRCQA
jgi:hypothetical protein